MNDLEKFYKSVRQEVTARQLANEEGDTQEQAFTRYYLDLLSDSGDTENATAVFHEKDLGTRNQHKINGYAIADNYETTDLFISIYQPEEEIVTITKAQIDQAVIRITNFFKKGIYNKLKDEIPESSEIFEYAMTLGSFDELRDNLIRVNIMILTNGQYKGELPAPIVISGYNIYYRVLDINYMFRISDESRVPIEIELTQMGFDVPCLKAGNENEDYEAYIAIIPGMCLAKLYEQYGARLLEQNVRSFLQFAGKINKGIRETIKKEPHMFFAFNNGIAATADHVSLDNTGHYITKISNLQIVNGGQTTASIFHTFKKDKADISNIFVQVKLSVIKKTDQFGDIVSRISRYANTQNKVNDADFTANNPYLVQFEKLSRFMLSPLTSESPLQTYWFFERARGQYKNLRQKEGFTKSRQDAFDKKYPKKQVITKVEMAKYINAYEEVYDGKKLVIGPHIVVLGNEKNYARYINNNLPDNVKKINNIYFEDAIAKTILFREADRRYGTKANDFNIGELRQVCVPYTIALLGQITERAHRRLNLLKIWNEQKLSDNLGKFLYDLMVQVNTFILEKSPITHYIEWSKKEECWQMVKDHMFAYDLGSIADDLYDENNPPQRKVFTESDDTEDKSQHELSILRAIPCSLWYKIAEWGKDSGCLPVLYQTAAMDMGHKIKFHRLITEQDRRRGMAIFELVCKFNIELLDEADALAAKDYETGEENGEEQSKISNEINDITMDLVSRMVKWDKYKHVLKDWQWKVMNDITEGRRSLDDKMKYICYMNFDRLKKRGFNENE